MDSKYYLLEHQKKSYMLRAKLIKNDKYYKLKRNQTLLMLLPSFPLGIIIDYYQIPLAVSIAMISIYLLLFILFLKNQKKIERILGSRLLEIDEREIRIKSSNGQIEEVIQLERTDRFTLRRDHSIEQENIKAYLKELVGQAPKSYLTLERDNKIIKLNFELDSHYGINQLDKIISKWQTNGLYVKIDQ